MKTNLIAFLILASSLVTTAGADTVTHFQAILTSDTVIKQGSPASISAGSGLVNFVLTVPDGNPSGATLSYDMNVLNADLDGNQTPGVGNELDNVSAIHIHDLTTCPPNSATCQLGDTAGTAHVLNVLGPAHEADYSANAAAYQADGIWDDGDEVVGMPPTRKISDPAIQNLLFGENLYFMVHTLEFPGGAFGGVITQIPEPNTLMLIGVVGAWFACRRTFYR